MKKFSYKDLIGKKIEWETRYSHRKKQGTVEDTKRKNILVNGNWEYSDNMINIKVIEQE